MGRKDWDGIIKVHSQTHAARDIRSKGAISNMDMKQNEKLNGAMRDAYHLQTNFRDVEAQVRGYLALLALWITLYVSWAGWKTAP